MMYTVHSAQCSPGAKWVVWAAPLSPYPGRDPWHLVTSISWAVSLAWDHPRGWGTRFWGFTIPLG